MQWNGFTYWFTPNDDRVLFLLVSRLHVDSTEQINNKLTNMYSTHQRVRHFVNYFPCFYTCWQVWNKMFLRCWKKKSLIFFQLVLESGCNLNTATRTARTDEEDEVDKLTLTKCHTFFTVFQQQEAHYTTSLLSSVPAAWRSLLCVWEMHIKNYYMNHFISQ